MRRHLPCYFVALFGALLLTHALSARQSFAEDADITFEQSAPTGQCACPPATPPAPPPDFGGCCWCRQKLTGNWGCCRPIMAEEGITFDPSVTQFYYGVASGGRDEEFEYGGHGDYLLNVDFGKLCQQEGLFLKVRAEHRYGRDINGNTGSFLPASLAAGLPVSNSEDLYVTDFLFTQFLSKECAVFMGKMDTLDGDANAFAHGRGVTQFSNMAFVANPAILRTVPYSTLGAGFTLLTEKMEPWFTFSVLNSTDTTRTVGFDELFNDGVALCAELRVPTNYWCKPGHQTLGGTWNSRDFVSLGQDPRIILPDVAIDRQTGSWALYWNFDQYLVVRSEAPLQGWGVFGRAAIADNGTNPIESFLSFGIGGNSCICGRAKDTFGVGWYWVNSSDEIGPFVEAVLGPVGNGQGVELFYNFEVSPWCHITPDLQIIEPGIEQFDTAVVAGLRVKMDF